MRADILTCRLRGAININKFVVANGEDESVVLYWYQTQGRVIADEFAAKFYLIVDSIRRHRSDTALVRVVVPEAQGIRHLTRDEANRNAVDFVQAEYPMVSSWLPQGSDQTRKHRGNAHPLSDNVRTI